VQQLNLFVWFTFIFILKLRPRKSGWRYDAKYRSTLWDVNPNEGKNVLYFCSCNCTLIYLHTCVECIKQGGQRYMLHICETTLLEILAFSLNLRAFKNIKNAKLNHLVMFLKSNGLVFFLSFVEGSMRQILFFVRRIKFIKFFMCNSNNI
jgi:hypothetical protein